MFKEQGKKIKVGNAVEFKKDVKIKYGKLTHFNKESGHITVNCDIRGHISEIENSAFNINILNSSPKHEEYMNKLVKKVRKYYKKHCD